MKTILLITLLSTLALAQGKIYYKSKSNINVIAEGDLNSYIDVRNCHNKQCSIYMLGKQMYFEEKDLMIFKKNINNYIRLNCNYNQKNNKIYKCKITSIRKWEKPDTLEINKN